MIIDEALCINCEKCLPYCPVSAIRSISGRVQIQQDECVECGVCLRSGVCPVEAFVQPELEWPRSVRRAFSDPLVPHKDTNVPGRGTEEMKTNDVTGRYRVGMVGIALELGRPGTGTRFSDVQKVAQTCAEFGVKFEPQNPVTSLMEDVSSGRLRPDVLDEKALSAIVEFDIEESRASALLRRLVEVSSDLDTVFSVDIITRYDPKRGNIIPGLAEAAGLPASANGKTNVGLGRPLK